jgi:hypothetical protein
MDRTCAAIVRFAAAGSRGVVSPIRTIPGTTLLLTGILGLTLRSNRHG